MRASAYSIGEIQEFVSQFYGADQRCLITPYGYNTTFSALTQNTQQSNIINIAANGDFILLGVNHRAQIGAAQNVGNKTAPFIRLLIIDSGSSEQFTASAVDLENYSTNGNVSNLLPFPRIVSGKSTLTIQATNYAPTAETYTTLDIFLSGVLVRPY